MAGIPLLNTQVCVPLMINVEAASRAPLGQVLDEHGQLAVKAVGQPLTPPSRSGRDQA